MAAEPLLPAPSAIGEEVLIKQLPSVRHIARRIRDHLPQHVPFEDLVQAGVLGLIDAHRKYDPAKCVQFPSYAKFRIRGAILDSLRELDWGPRELRRRARDLEQAVQKLTVQLGRLPQEEDIAAELKISLNELHEVARDVRVLEVASFTAVASEGSGDEDLSNQLHAAPESDPSCAYERAEWKTLLLDLIGHLPEKEGKVLYLYYFEERSMKEIGELLGVGESRISQIHAAAMARSRELLFGPGDHPLSTYTPPQN